MRAGRLRDKAQISTLDHNLNEVWRGTSWCGITAKEAASPPMPSGLRAGARIDVRVRYTSKLHQGAYLRAGTRLLHVTSVRDATGKRAELTASCDEFVGQPATYYPADSPPISCRTHLTYDAPYLDDFGKVTDYRIKAEVLLIEVGRPQENDRLEVGGVMFIVTQYASDTDDGVVRGLWLDTVE